MPATKVNYLCYFIGESQIYGSASKQIVLDTPPPPGVELENKRIGFITWEPDNERMTFHPLPIEEIMSADIKYPKKKERSDE